jgi:amphi-Trp domain-containing protein
MELSDYVGPDHQPRSRTRSRVTEFKHEERLSRRQAAERLADMAYALTVGGTLEVRVEGGRVKVPVADRVLMTRESRTNDGRIEVVVRVTWSA